VQLGVLLFIGHDLGSATEALREALALEPENSEARYQLAMVLLARGDAEAVKELERVLIVAPDHVGALTDLGVLALARGDHAGAAARLERALGGAPDAARPLYYRALAYDQTGQGEACLELLKRVEQSDDAKYASLAREYRCGARHSAANREVH
jgi:Flp pilus assembly protein TadD